jgi:hypothetical protein
MDVSHDDLEFDFLEALVHGYEDVSDQPDKGTYKETTSKRIESGTASANACAVCGFIEPGLIKTSAADGDDRFICRECHVYEAPALYAEDFVLSWLPDYSRSGLSLLLKLWPTAHQTSPEYEIAKQAYRKSEPEDKDQSRDIRQLSTFFIPSNTVSHDNVKQLTEAMIASVDQDFKPFIIEISKGIKTATEIFGKASFKEIHAALPHMPEDDRNRLLFGLRYIPQQIDTPRLKTFESKWFLDNLYQELIAEIQNRTPKTVKKEVGETEGGGGHADTPAVEQETAAVVQPVDPDPTPELPDQKPGQEQVRRHWIKRLIGWGE